MKNCKNCRKKLIGDEIKVYLKKLYCEDCYIELILSKSRKAPYFECDHSFMLRLKPAFDNQRLMNRNVSIPKSQDP